MKTLRNLIYSGFLVLLFLPLTVNGQHYPPKDSSDMKLVSAAREILAAAGTCALITLDDEGRPRVRAMDPFAPEVDFTVWFGTNAQSRKVDQIRKDPRVTLYYLDSDASGYVMIYGNAQLVNDTMEKEKHWKDAWEAFYPNKSKDYLLIKVTPVWMEVSSTPRGIHGDSVTWEPPFLKFDSNK